MRLCALLALLLATPAAAEPPPPLEWLPDAGALEVTAQEPATAQVLNRTSSALDIQVRVVPLASKKPPMALTPEPAKATLGPGEAFTFTIAAPAGAGQETGSYVLVAYANAEGSSIRRNLQLAVRSEGPAVSGTTSLEFLVPSVKLRAYRGLSWLDPLEDAGIPARVGKKVSWESPTAWLATEDGEMVELSLREPRTEGVQGLKVRLGDVDRVGKYEGKLQTGTGKEEGKAVTLTLTVAHHPLFAVAAVAFGILLALWVKRYTGVLRLTWPLAEREAGVGVKFENARKAFDREARGKPFEGYSLSDLVSRRRNLRGDIGKLQRSVFASVDTSSEKYKAIEAELKVLEAVPVQWEGFAPLLSRLADALAGEDAPPRPKLEKIPERPAIHDSLRKLLTGSAITVQELGERSTEVSKGPDRLAAWRELNHQAAQLQTRIDELREAASGAPAAQSELEKAEEALHPIWKRLWLRPDVDPSAQNGLETAGNHLDRAWALIHKGKGRKEGLDSGARAELAEMLRSLTAEPAEEPLSDAERLQLLRRRQRHAAWAVALLGFLIALYTGMKELYIGKPFGHWLDYVAIVAWAVAAQTGIELLLRGLDRIWDLGVFRTRTS